jgi:uncharacterized iron-regulated membrane protein
VIKKTIRNIHRWLGLLSGLVVCFLGITGCILAFQREIETVSVPYQYVKAQKKEFLLPAELQAIAKKALPGKSLHSVIYGESNKSAQMVFYHDDPSYYYIVYINPYTGEVLKVKNMDRDFFRVVVMGHYYLWLPPHIGQPIVAYSTLIFFIMMVTGIILWWPRNKSARKQRFTIRWNVRWRRRNYDLHNVLGFYMSWIALFIAITGMVMGIQWFAKGFYKLTSGGKAEVEYYEPVSSPKTSIAFNAVDEVYKRMQKNYPSAQLIEVHYPETDSAVIAANANPDAGTYWKTDYRYFDQYSLQEINVSHAFGRFANTTVADKISRMNYDVHVGAIGGLPTKILVFFASLVAASLPVTGFLVWRGRVKKKKQGAARARVNMDENIPIPV